MVVKIFPYALFLRLCVRFTIGQAPYIHCVFSGLVDLSIRPVVEARSLVWQHDCDIVSWHSMSSFFL
jgi:hypothetical protein